MEFTGHHEQRLKAISSEIQNLSLQSGVYVGCDSASSVKLSSCRFIVAIVMHIDCSCGSAVRTLTFREKRYMSMQERLYREIELAVMTMQQLLPAIGQRKHELHFDINPDPKFASNVMQSTALGWGNAISVPVKLKPDAFAASAVADHILRKPLVAA